MTRRTTLDSVEVIIPNFNRHEKLIRAVESVLNQSSNLVTKISIYDDGSSVELNDEIEKYFIKETVVSLNRMPHSGNPGSLRKLGVSRATTKYVAFLDSDDWWDPRKIEIQLGNLLGSKCIASSTNGYHWEARGPRYFFESHRSIPSKIGFEDLISENFVINSSMVVNLEFLKMIGDYASSSLVKSVEDYATWLRLLTFGTIAYINEPLVHYSDTDKLSSIRASFQTDPRHKAIEDFILWSHLDPRRKEKFVDLAKLELINLKENSK